MVPTKNGSAFSGWRVADSEEPVGKSIVIEEDLDLYPLWVPKDTSEGSDRTSGGQQDGTVSTVRDGSDNRLLLTLSTGATVAAILSVLAVFQIRRN